MSQRSKAMIHKRSYVASVMLLVVLESCGGYAGTAQPMPKTQEKQAVSQSKFYCNTKALNPAERARHKLLTEKLVAQRTRIVETEKGYEFQYGPSVVSLEELTKWVAAESKCCPFFDFHIDLENEGALLCLRLTGEKGIKEFVRSEFSVPAAN
jgi:hypothetical protein